MARQYQKQGAHLAKTRVRTYQVLVIQFAVTLAMSGLLLLHSWTSAYSAFLGGLIYLIPSAYFAKRTLTHTHDLDARQIVFQMYSSQIWKMALTGVGFASAFVLVKPISPFPLIGSYILLQFLNGAAQIWLNHRFLKT